MTYSMAYRPMAGPTGLQHGLWAHSIVHGPTAWRMDSITANGVAWLMTYVYSSP